MDHKQEYLRWLEDMWDVQKFDVPGRTEREEERKDEILEALEDLGRLARCHVEAPEPPFWQKSPGSSDARSPEAPPGASGRGEAEG